MSLGGSVTARIDLVVGDPLQPEPGGQAPLGPQVVVLEGQRGEAGIGRLASWRSRQRSIRRRLATQSTWSASSSGSVSRPARTSSQRRRTSAPTSSPTDGQASLLGPLAGPVEQLPLDLEGGHGDPVDRLEGLAARVGSWDTLRTAATGGRSEVAIEGVVFDHGQDDGGGADLQEGGHLGQVGVTGDDVEPAVALGVGVGLVAGVDDGPLERGLQPDLGLEEVGPLAELVRHVAGGGPAASTPTLPDPVKTWRVTKWVVAAATIRAKGTARSMR